MVKKGTKRVFDPRVTERHHLLWPAKFWDSAGQYSRLLRLHPYMIKIIPRDTLHREIHSKMAMVPLPTQDACKKAYLAIESAIADGSIDAERDTIEQRIDFLLGIMDFDSFPGTFLALKWQRELVSEFYKTTYFIYHK